MNDPSERTSNMPPSRGSVWFLRLFVASLVLACVGTWFFGRWVVAQARENAQRTDTQIRTLAWAALAYAEANSGAFPMTADELRAFGVGPTTITPPGDAATETLPWPLDRSAALKGREPAALDDALRAILVTWGTDRTMPPYLKPDGLPTLHGTNTEVNGWLGGYREKQRAQRTPG